MNAGDEHTLSVKVNDDEYLVAEAPDRTLLDVLRDDLSLTGTKKACDRGECGSCTVLLAGKSAMSCLIDISRVGDKAVTTIEGLAERGKNALHPLQQAFLNRGAAQCGFCIPGVIMEAEPLLRREREPSRDDVRRRLNRNMCRCTGYQKVVDAVIEAWRAVHGVETSPGPADGAWTLEGIGARVPKLDGEQHVTGRSMYAADLAATGALHVAVVRSPHHHARIVDVDIEGAKALPGVELALTAADLPAGAEMLNGRPQPYLLARDKVRFVGEAVVAIVAESEAIATKAAEQVVVEYDVLPSVLDPARAMTAEVSIEGALPNWNDVSTIELGDVDAALAEAAVVVEGTYQTAPREHAPMEPEAGVSCFEDGVLVIRSPQHHPFAAQHWIADMLGMKSADVRIVCPAMGGNFGHRGDFLHTALLAIATAKTGKPARMVFSREESLLGSSKSTSFLIRYKTAADSTGRLTAVVAELIGDGGCWIPHPAAGTKKSSLQSIGMFAPGPYRVPNAYIRVVEACTNRPRSNPMRGTNIPDMAFAWESQLDMVADALGLDRLEVRIRNALEKGDKTVTGAVLDESVSARATLEALQEPYSAALARAAHADTSGSWRRGVGIAATWYVMGGGRLEEAGGGWHGLKLGQAKGGAELMPDGTVCVRSGLVEKGQGISIAVQQVAAAELGVPLDHVTMVFGDTTLAPYPIGTSGQRTLFHAGGAVQRACGILRRVLLDVAADEFGADPGEVSLESGRFVRGQATLTFADLWSVCRARGVDTSVEAEFVFEPSADGVGPVFPYAAQLVELDVDTETGSVVVDRVTYVADPGRVINWQTFEGQVEGGVVMGLSYALKERYVSGETRTLKDYGIPTPMETPPIIETLVVENPVTGGPFGAKGMAEMTASGGIASVTNAVADACGARCYRAPARPDVVRRALARGGGSPILFPDLRPGARVGDDDPR